MSYNKKCRWFSMEYVGNPGAVPSCNRDAVLEVFDCSTCEENPNNAKRTNADRIRAMSDKELAIWMNSIIKDRNIEVTCDGWLIWLKSPAKESGHEE